MHGNKGYLQSSKKGAIYIMNTYGCIKNTDAKKNLFYETVLDLTSFLQDLGLFFLFFFLPIYFCRTLFPVILFPETLLAAPKLY